MINFKINMKIVIIMIHDDDDQCLTISHHDNSSLSSDLDSDIFFRHPRVPVAAKPLLYLPIYHSLSFFICQLIILYHKTSLLNYADKNNRGKSYLKGGKCCLQQTGKLVTQLPFEISKKQQDAKSC